MYPLFISQTREFSLFNLFDLEESIAPLEMRGRERKKEEWRVQRFFAS
jgi:hypothetical protein